MIKISCRIILTRQCQYDRDIIQPVRSRIAHFSLGGDIVNGSDFVQTYSLGLVRIMDKIRGPLLCLILFPMVGVIAVNFLVMGQWLSVALQFLLGSLMIMSYGCLRYSIEDIMLDMTTSLYKLEAPADKKDLKRTMMATQLNEYRALLLLFGAVDVLALMAWICLFLNTPVFPLVTGLGGSGLLKVFVWVPDVIVLVARFLGLLMCLLSVHLIIKGIAAIATWRKEAL